MIDVVTVAFINNNKLLVVKPRSSIKSNKYTLIGGKVRVNESYSDAIIRETYEELNIKLSLADLSLILEFSEKAASDDNLIINMHMYLSNKIIETLPSINSEIFSYEWIDIDKENEQLSNSIRYHLLPYLRTLFL